METTVEPGIGEYQSKLAKKLRESSVQLNTSFLFAKKRHDPSAKGLYEGIKLGGALEEAIQTMIKCLNTHEDREDFAQTILKKLDDGRSN